MLKESESKLIQLGVDGVTVDAFKNNLNNNARDICERVLSGKFCFRPMREFEILKPNGKPRTLSIARIHDVLVQHILLPELMNSAETRYFKPAEIVYHQRFQGYHQSPDFSYAYRNGYRANETPRIICDYFNHGFCVAIDADIAGFFDNINHKHMETLIDGWVGHTTLIGTLLRRFMHTRRVTFKRINEEMNHPKNKGKTLQQYLATNRPQSEARIKGIPQGGVLSGLLANLYLHSFDCWVITELSKRLPLRYLRYADDFIIFVKDRTAAEQLMKENTIDNYLSTIDLTLSFEKSGTPPKPKTRISDISSGELEFVGFHFAVRKNNLLVRVRHTNIQRFKDRVETLFNKYEADTKTCVDSTGELSKQLIDYQRRSINAIQRRILGRVCPKCHKIQVPIGEIAKRRNWAAFFGPAITDDEQIFGLDTWLRRRIRSFNLKKYGQVMDNKLLQRRLPQSLYIECKRAKGKPRLCQCILTVDEPESNIEIFDEWDRVEFDNELST